MDRSGAGAVINQKYRLERKLGQGGMGQVWVARHLQLESEVALKLLVSEHADTPGARARFEREAKAAAQVKSPHIVHVFDYGLDGEIPYLAMELLEGEDLATRLEREGRLSIAAAAQLVPPVCKALRRIHDAGLVHRDLKPSNIYLARHDDEDHVKILDFGIAKTTALTRASDTTSGIVVGSPPYMSPEQILARKELDHRTDLWSLGVILYRALTGKLPFSSEIVTQLLMEICMAPPALASRTAGDLGPDVDAFFERALAKDAAERFQTGAELADAFAALARMGNDTTRIPTTAAVPATITGPPTTTTGQTTITAPPTGTLPGGSDATVPLDAPPAAAGPAPAPRAPETSPDTDSEPSPTASASPAPAPAAAKLADIDDDAPAPASLTHDPAPENAPVEHALAREAPPKRRDTSLLPAVVIGAVLAALLVAAATALSPAADQATSGQASRPEMASGSNVTSAVPVPASSASATSPAAAAAFSTRSTGASAPDTAPPPSGPSPAPETGRSAAPRAAATEGVTAAPPRSGNGTAPPPPERAPTPAAAEPPALSPPPPSPPPTAPPPQATSPKREFW